MTKATTTVYQHPDGHELTYGDHELTACTPDGIALSMPIGVLGLAAVVMASINIFGGFAVTARMLAMYKKKER